MPTKKHVLLLGGTGAMGVYLVPRLAKLGYMVTVTSRQQRESSNKNVTYIQGDAKDDTFLASHLKKRHYDAIVDFMVYHTDEFKARLDKLMSHTKHYVYLSSYRVYAGSDGPLVETSSRLLDVVQDDAYLRTDEYGLTKARQEDVLQRSSYPHWTVVRPAITYSKDRFQLGTMEANEFLHRALDGKEVIFPHEMLKKKTTMSWAGDVAEMIARITTKRSTFGKTYTAATAENHTWQEVIDIYKDIVNLKVRIIPIADYRRIIGRPYQIVYDRMYDRVIDNTAILKVAGMKQSNLMPLAKGLRNELKEFIKSPKFGTIDQDKDKKMEQLLSGEANTPTVRSRVRAKLRKVKRVIRSKIDYDGAILSLGGYYNYGGLIQRYALQTFLRKSGFHFKVFRVEFMRKFGKKEGDRRNLERFAKTYLDEETFHPILGAFYRAYIVGSDQVWRDWFGARWEKFGSFFFSFVKNPKAKRIAYAASFGVDDLASAGINASNRQKIRRLIKKFDAISVREHTAVKMVNQLHGEATTTLDPTLLLTKEDYSKLIDNFAAARDFQVQPIFSYMLDPTAAKESVVWHIEKKNKVAVTTLYPRNGKQLTHMEIWLKGFRDSDIVVTDSFHGIALSVINRKQFIAFGNKTRGLARMTDLLGPLGLSHRILDEENLEHIDIDALLKPIDWKHADSVLQQSRKESADWLLSALDS